MSTSNHGGPEGPRALSIKASASYLGVSPDTVRRLVDAGELPAFRVGSKLLRIMSADLDALMRPVRRRQQRPAPQSLGDVP